jgi:tetratricopeptide (TPR) repeat protein
MVAVCLVDLSEILIAQGKTKEAEGYLLEAFATEQKLSASFPGVHEYLSILEVSSRRLSDLLTSSGRAQEAEKTYRHLLEISEKMAADFPGEISYRLTMATFSQNLANLLLQMEGRTSEGETVLRQAVEIQKDLVAKNPDSASCRARLFRGLANMAGVQRLGGEPTKGAETYVQALALLDNASPDFPGTLLNPVEISNTFCEYAILLKDQGRLPEGLALLSRAEKTGVFDFAARSALEREVMQLRGRYPIACAMVSVGCGLGVDEKESARRRRQALEYLRTDLAFWSKQIHSRQPAEHIEAFGRLSGWAIDPNLASVRGEALPGLSASEREAWQKFWGEIKSLLGASLLHRLIPH